MGFRSGILFLSAAIHDHSQTPTLNARPIKRAIKQACRRGVEVVLYLDLGEPSLRKRESLLWLTSPVLLR